MCHRLLPNQLVPISCESHLTNSLRFDSFNQIKYIETFDPSEWTTDPMCTVVEVSREHLVRDRLKMKRGDVAPYLYRQNVVGCNAQEGALRGGRQPMRATRLTPPSRRALPTQRENPSKRGMRGGESTEDRLSGTMTRFRP